MVGPKGRHGCAGEPDGAANRETWANAYKYSYPRETPDQSLNELTSSLKDLAPEQFKSFSAPRECSSNESQIRVISDLQRQNNMPGKLGISFELEDMRNQQERDLCTIWEPTAQDTAVGDPQPPAVAPPGQSSPSRKEQRRGSKVASKKTELPAEEKEARALCKCQVSNSIGNQKPLCNSRHNLRDVVALCSES